MGAKRGKETTSPRPVGSIQGDRQQAGPVAGHQEFDKACQLHQNGKVEEAQIWYERCLTLNPRHVDAWRNLGGLMRQLNRPDQALKCAERAIAIRPDDAGLWGNAGNALRDLDRLDESERAFRQACLLEPGNLGQRLGLAITLNKARRHWDVIELVDSIDRSEENKSRSLAELMLEIGNAYHCIQNKDKALDCWEQAIENSDSEKQLLMVLNIAQVLCETNRHKQAKSS